MLFCFLVNFQNSYHIRIKEKGNLRFVVCGFLKQPLQWWRKSAFSVVTSNSHILGDQTSKQWREKEE
jgi:hypothetical protein